MNLVNVSTFHAPRFRSGLHHIAISVQDARGVITRVEHSFSLDGSLHPLPLASKILLKTDWQSCLVFGCLVLVLMVLLLAIYQVFLQYIMTRVG